MVVLTSCAPKLAGTKWHGERKVGRCTDDSCTKFSDVTTTIDLEFVGDSTLKLTTADPGGGFVSTGIDTTAAEPKTETNVLSYALDGKNVIKVTKPGESEPMLLRIENGKLIERDSDNGGTGTGQIAFTKE